MPSFNLIQLTKDSYSVEGDLTFASLNIKEIQPINFLNSGKNIEIDLANVNLADSSGLALLVEWIKQSKKTATKLIFKNIPNQITTLSTLSDIDINADNLVQEH